MSNEDQKAKVDGARKVLDASFENLKEWIDMLGLRKWAGLIETKVEVSDGRKTTAADQLDAAADWHEQKGRVDAIVATADFRGQLRAHVVRPAKLPELRLIHHVLLLHADGSSAVLPLSACIASDCGGIMVPVSKSLREIEFLDVHRKGSGRVPVGCVYGVDECSPPTFVVVGRRLLNACDSGLSPFVASPMDWSLRWIGSQSEAGELMIGRGLKGRAEGGAK